MSIIVIILSKKCIYLFSQKIIQFPLRISFLIANNNNNNNNKGLISDKTPYILSLSLSLSLFLFLLENLPRFRRSSVKYRRNRMCLSGLMGRERIHNPVGGWASARRDRGGMVDKGDRRKTWVWRRRTGGINRSFESIRQILFLRRLSMLSLTRKYCAVSFRARAETILLHATPRRERVPGYLLNDVRAQGDFGRCSIRDSQLEGWFNGSWKNWRILFFSISNIVLESDIYTMASRRWSIFVQFHKKKREICVV